ncbi:MAG: TolC family protein [Epsilonproteobacteria bacterium]|nr:hypothetical protein [Campylobacterota bacterium]NPA56188.1 TolC family protein [Campylobacterota bacterium]
MGRLFLLLSILTLALYGEWCIFCATQKRIHDHEDKIFLKKFEKAHIVHYNGFYRFLIGPFKEKREALARLKVVRRSIRDAYLKRCGADIIRYSINSNRTEGGEKRGEVKLSKVFGKKWQERSQKGGGSGRSPTAKSSPLRREEGREFYNLTFYEYIDRLLHRSPYSQIEEITYRLNRLQALIQEREGYQWEINGFLSATYSKFIDYELATNKEGSIKGGVSVNKKLFDRRYAMRERLSRLSKELAKIQYINNRDRLYLLGVQFYLTALLEQKIRELYDLNYQQQKRFVERVKERYRSKLVPRIDYLNAQEDLLSLKKQLLEHLYAYLYSDYLIRNSAELESDKPLKLSWFGVEPQKKRLEEYYKNALLHSPRIEAQRLRSRMEKGKIVSLRYFYLPEVTFNALIYDEYRRDFGLSPSQTATGLNYQAFLNITFPLWKEGVEREEERAQVAYRLEREKLKREMKELIKDIHKSFNEIKRLRRKRKIVEEQLRLAQEKREVSQKRYLSGIGSYRDYSEAVKQVVNYREELYRIDADLLSNTILLNLLEGIERLYE